MDVVILAVTSSTRRCLHSFCFLFLHPGLPRRNLYIQEDELDVIVESSSHTLHPGDCILINANIIHSTKCTVPNKAIVLQIPLDFMEKYIPNVQQLVFFWDYQTKDPVKKTKIEMLKTTLEQLIIFRNIIQYKVQPIQIFFLLA